MSIGYCNIGISLVKTLMGTSRSIGVPGRLAVIPKISWFLVSLRPIVHTATICDVFSTLHSYSYEGHSGKPTLSRLFRQETRR